MNHLGRSKPPECVDGLPAGSLPGHSSSAVVCNTQQAGPLHQIMGDWGAVQLVRSKRSDYRSGEDIEFNRVIDR